MSRSSSGTAAAVFDIVVVAGNGELTGRAHTFGEVSASPAHLERFGVFAQTLSGWRSPATPVGREVLERHSRRAARHRENGLLLFAGPVEVGSIGPGAPAPAGRITGMLVCRAATSSHAA